MATTIQMLTAKELANSPFPELPMRLSQRRSSSRTQPVTPRTFSHLKEWVNFLGDARGYSATLDSQMQQYPPPMVCFGPLPPCSDEVGVRGALENLLFPMIEKLVNVLGIPFIYRSGGSGRSYSYTHMVTLDTSVPQGEGERKTLSARVYGNGEAKGPWQWLMPPSQGLGEALEDSKHFKKFVEPLQQMFGDMVLDETRYGFITNYNQTIFFRRAANVLDKTLEFSPVISINNAPIEAYLFVLHQAHSDQFMKQHLRRESVPITPQRGYVLMLPPVTKSSSGRAIRKSSSTRVKVKAMGKGHGRVRGSLQDGGGSSSRDLSHSSGVPIGNSTSLEVDLSDFSVQVFVHEDFVRLPQYNFTEIGLTSRVIGMGKYGNVVEGGVSSGLPLALKMFDLRLRDAAEAFVREQMTYRSLRTLQGHCTPILYAVGCIPHCNIVYIALSDVGGYKLGSSPITRSQKMNVLHALERIHELGILHNDLKLSHVLLFEGIPKFIDFEESLMTSNIEELNNESRYMQELLEVEA